MSGTNPNWKASRAKRDRLMRLRSRLRAYYDPNAGQVSYVLERIDMVISDWSHDEHGNRCRTIRAA